MVGDPVVGDPVVGVPVVGAGVGLGEGIAVAGAAVGPGEGAVVEGPGAHRASRCWITNSSVFFMIRMSSLCH